MFHLLFFFFKTGWEGSSEGDLISKRQLPAECECDACQVKQRKDGEKLFFFFSFLPNSFRNAKRPRNTGSLKDMVILEKSCVQAKMEEISSPKLFADMCIMN